MNRKSACLFIAVAFAATTNSRASLETNGSDGINSVAVPFTGEGISIGQVELLRPGTPEIDDASNSNFATIPEDVFLLDDRVAPTPNSVSEIYDADDDPHATWVVAVMISNDGFAPGVAKDANLYSSHGSFNAIPAIPLFDSLALSTQFIATRDDDDVRAINLSFAVPFEEDVGPNGNSKFTEFVDWSSEAHNVLYVAANRNSFTPPGLGQPMDNYNGMTVAASTKVNGVYRQVAGFVDVSVDATGDRTTISLLAPGDGVEVADVGGGEPPVVLGSSYAAPHVVGTAALLQEFADQQIEDTIPGWNANARRHEVMKAVLMNSADKLLDSGDGKRLGMTRNVVDQQGDNWLLSEAYSGVNSDETPLDDQMGAGHLNARRAYQQFQPGEMNPGGAPVAAVGWDYGFTDGFESIVKYVLAPPIDAMQFVSITLAWDRELLFDVDNGDPGVFDEGDSFIDFATPVDLNLYLMPAGATNIGMAIAQSNSPDSSVEHIFFEVQNQGQYEIWVEQASGGLSQIIDYGLAWWMAAIPDDSVPGDYSGNGTVGPEDYAVWKSSYGDMGGPADGNGDGIVDAADYTVWRNALGSGSGSGGLANVPEPSILALLVTGLVCVGIRRFRQ